MDTATLPRVFSTPGKALLAGGYLVLDPKYESFVTALSSRMHCYAKKIAKGQGEEGDGSLIITVRSPQFLSGLWSYRVSLPTANEKDSYLTLKEMNGRKNPFVESTINVIMSYVLPEPKLNYNIEAVMFSDAGYHSQVETEAKQSTDGTLTFNYHTKEIHKAAKTGLGSSAGLVTSLTTGLLSCFIDNLDTKDPQVLNIIHNLSQIAHCHAQGKIGSGFDVASATFGSIVYRRFKPEVISDLIENLNMLSIQENHVALRQIVDSKWDMKNEKCSLPRGIKLLMGDIVGGSETPKLVSKVLSWRASYPEESLKLFTDLDNSNMSLVKSLTDFHQYSIEKPEEYDQLLDYLDTHSNQQIDSLIQFSVELKKKLTPLLNIVESIKSIRHNLRLLTRFTGAEIEPMEQTILLNNTNTLKGVLGGVIPGAGGYDAICLLVCEKSISNIISETKASAVKSGKELNAVDKKLFDLVSWLDLGEQSEGILEEDPKSFEGLV